MLYSTQSLSPALSLMETLSKDSNSQAPAVHICEGLLSKSRLSSRNVYLAPPGGRVQRQDEGKPQKQGGGGYRI